MHTRHHTITLRRGEVTISVERDDSVWPSRFIGSIAGKYCVVAPSKASAVRTLLLRLATERDG